MDRPIFDINVNEGGKGFVFSFRLNPFFLYICYWTDWFAPRIFVNKRKFGASYEP